MASSRFAAHPLNRLYSSRTVWLPFPCPLLMLHRCAWHCPPPKPTPFARVSRSFSQLSPTRPLVQLRHLPSSLPWTLNHLTRPSSLKLMARPFIVHPLSNPSKPTSSRADSTLPSTQATASVAVLPPLPRQLATPTTSFNCLAVGVATPIAYISTCRLTAFLPSQLSSTGPFQLLGLPNIQSPTSRLVWLPP